MRFKNISFLFFIYFFTLSGIAQGQFQIMDAKKESITIPFSLINNMMVISAEVNGKELSFLLDTGLEKTILFNLKFSDSLILHDVEKLQLRGLGVGKPINALKSKNNVFKIKGIINPNHLLYIIIDDMFDLSAKMGVDINGIVGGDLLKDFIVKINYANKRITFYNPETYVYNKCNKCEVFPLDFYNKKPFINVNVENYLGDVVKVKLLIDSGGGDALWLFEHSHPKIIVSENYFKDYLGKGLNGNIYGKRSKIDKLIIGGFIFENASVSYPDSTSIVAVHKNKDRNGTLGAGILKRFHVILDYPNRKITLKKNSRFFKEPFLYNKSGIELVYGGERLVKEKRARFPDSGQNNNNSITQIIYSYALAYKPSYQISFIRDGSPAKIAGLLVGDIILEINRKLAYNIEMQEITQMLSQKEDKKIKLLIDRDGKHLNYQFNLKSML